MVCIDDEIPFEIPASWEWCRFGVVSNYGECNTVKASNIKDTDWILDLEDIEKDSGRILKRVTQQEKQSLSNKHSFFAGQLLYSKLRPYLNKVVIATEDGYCTTEIIPINFNGWVLPKYGQIFLMSYYFLTYANMLSYGVKMPRMGTSDGRKVLFPLAPISEQKRIISQVDSLLSLVDNVDNSKADLQIIIQQTKSKVLDLAIRGKLVPQDPTDEPASMLLERIKAEKQATAKPLKRGAKTASTTSDNSHYPNDIQEGWVWCNLNDICIINPRNNISDDTDCSFIPMPMIADGFRNKHTFEIRKWNEIKKGFTHFRDNDLAIAKITPCFENRKSVVLKNLEGGAGAGTTEIFILRPILYSTMSEYLLLLAKTNQFISGGIANFNGAVGQQRVTREYIETYKISLPPLNEQKRIVAKVDEIFEQLDNIEKALME